MKNSKMPMDKKMPMKGMDKKNPMKKMGKTK